MSKLNSQSTGEEVKSIAYKNLPNPFSFPHCNLFLPACLVTLLNPIQTYLQPSFELPQHVISVGDASVRHLSADHLCTPSPHIPGATLTHGWTSNLRLSEGSMPMILLSNKDGKSVVFFFAANHMQARAEWEDHVGQIHLFPVYLGERRWG